MSSSEDEVLIFLSVIRKRRRRKRKNIDRRWWVHPYWATNASRSSQFVVSKQLEVHEDKFQNLYRMEKETFKKLCAKMKSYFILKHTNYRETICVEERLMIFIRYLSTGMTFSSLAYEFYRGVSTISEVIEHTAICTWNMLEGEYMSMPSEEEWINISDRFYKLWNMPNCVGCIDGKHIRIKCPAHSGSAFFNYHGFFSIVLLGCVDADGLLTWISVGDYGRNSDGRVVKASGFLQALDNNDLKIPASTPLPNTTDPPFPYFFLGDQGFPLRDDLFRPYARKGGNDKRRVFNYRLSRARKSVECCFGMLANKFRLLLTQIECSPEKATNIVKAACILHNFIKIHDGTITLSKYENDIADAYNQMTSFQPANPEGQKTSAKLLRDVLCDYFTRPENALPYQNVYNE